MHESECSSPTRNPGALLAETMAAVRALVASTLARMKAMFRALADLAKRHTTSLRQLKTVDKKGKAARRADRPAWQSPYGPAIRRRHTRPSHSPAIPT